MVFSTLKGARYTTIKPLLDNRQGEGILTALQSEEVQWEADGLQSVYCIRHFASNFNKKFKNHELKNRLKNMGNKNFLSFTIFGN